MVAVTAVIVAVVGYAGWSFLRPDPYSLSERVVRDARRELSAEVREFQRQVDGAVRDAKMGQAATAGAEIDKALADAEKAIGEIVDDARDRLAELDVAIRTQRNRLDRIDHRADEARGMIKELAAEAKQRLQGG